MSGALHIYERHETDDEILVAVVHAADGVRFAVSTDSPALLADRLADYVSARADDVLWPEEADHLRTLLDGGDVAAAVECYFWHVGDRWDAEWLVTSRRARLECGAERYRAGSEPAAGNVPEPLGAAADSRAARPFPDDGEVP